MRAACTVLFAVLALAGCSRTFQSRVVQSHPLNAMAGSRVSQPAEILLGDMELAVPAAPPRGVQVATARNLRYPLRNVATFALVSQDRVRFHVQLEHKWPSWADVRTWEVYLVDSDGHRYEPAGIERASVGHSTSMWDREVRTAQRNLYGDITAFNEDGWARRQTFGTATVFRGVADITFREPEVFTENLQGLRLVVARPGTTYEFVWVFRSPDADDQAPPQN